LAQKTDENPCKSPPKVLGLFQQMDYDKFDVHFDTLSFAEHDDFCEDVLESLILVENLFCGSSLLYVNMNLIFQTRDSQNPKLFAFSKETYIKGLKEVKI
jgi:hypothetical protein